MMGRTPMSEGKNTAGDQGGAFGIEAIVKVEGGFDAGLTDEAGFGQGGCAERSSEKAQD